MSIYRASHKNPSKFETYAWFYVRVSGVLFLLMGAFDILYANLVVGRGGMSAGEQMRWAFFPISFHSSAIPSNAFWQIWSFLLVSMAITHGMNGLRIILDDYIRHPLWLRWWQAATWLTWVSFMAMTAWIVFSF